MKAPMKELPMFVNRTYRGGKMLREFLGMENCQDDFFPEDWISSFTEAKNKVYIEGEGITKVISDGKETAITEAVDNEDFGVGRSESGVLIKLLDSAERLGIQVHPTKAYARSVFNSDYGKTECWHIIGGRAVNGEKPCVYLGFKEFVTKELWKELFDKQDIQGMLDSLHKFEVKEGDTILVTGGTPHAIGAGCFMLEIQEPSDYTMRVEKTTVAGETLTPNQIHYGVGEEKMLDCFDYTPVTREQIREKYFLSEKNKGNNLVTYEDTPCFALDKVDRTEYNLNCTDCVTVIILEDGGKLVFDGNEISLLRGEKYFIPAGSKVKLSGAKALLSYPPEK